MRRECTYGIYTNDRFFSQRVLLHMLSMLDIFNICSNSIIYNVTITKKKIPTF